MISQFGYDKLDPDGAVFVDCRRLKEFNMNPGAFEGFLVIESRTSLDVVAAYTAGADDQVRSMDVEYIRERLLGRG